MRNPADITPQHSDATLNIIARTEFIGAVSDFTFKWSLNSGLPVDESIRFAQAITEMVTDIILFAYPHDDEGHFTIYYTRYSTHLDITILEWGEPFDPDRHRYDSRRALEEDDFEGAGLMSSPSPTAGRMARSTTSSSM